MDYANDLDLSFMSNILNKHLTKEQKYTMHLIKQKNKVLGQLRALKDQGFELYITATNPNGTNDLLITKDSEIVECIPEFCFGLGAVTPDKEYQNVTHSYNNNIQYLSDYSNIDDDTNFEEVSAYLTYVMIKPCFTIAEAMALSPENAEYNYQVNTLGAFIAATK